MERAQLQQPQALAGSFPQDIEQLAVGEAGGKDAPLPSPQDPVERQALGPSARGLQAPVQGAMLLDHVPRDGHEPPGLDQPVHESRVTGVQNGIELRADFEGASVERTESALAPARYLIIASAASPNRTGPAWHAVIFSAGPPPLLGTVGHHVGTSSTSRPRSPHPCPTPRIPPSAAASPPRVSPRPSSDSSAAKTWNSSLGNSASPPPPSPAGGTTSWPAARPR